MPGKILLPWYWTPREMQEFAAKLYAPNGVPHDVKLENAPPPEPVSEADAIGWTPGQ